MSPQKLTSTAYNLITENVRAKVEQSLKSLDSLKLGDSRSVYHYTTAMGLKGIIETNSLWATGANYLNDKEEILHGINENNRVLEEILLETRISVEYKDFVGKMKLPKQSNSADWTYLICFTTKGDQLSQWRGYGSNAIGYSIEFDAEELKEYFISTQKSTALILNIFDSVVYTQASKTRLIKTVIQEFYDECIKQGESDTSIMASHCKSLLINYLNLLKNYSFREESEVRASFSNIDFLDTANVFYRVQNGIFIPHLIVDNKDSKLPIKSIRVGPNSDFQRIKKGIEIFIEKNGLNKIQVVDSKIPYRT